MASTMPIGLLFLPLASCSISLIPTAFLSVLATLSGSWEFSLPIGMALRAMGASSLVFGHYGLCGQTLTRGDTCYLTGTSLLALFFLSVCGAKLKLSSTVPPPEVMVTGGGLLIGSCFVDMVKAARGISTLPLAKRCAVCAGLFGSSMLIAAGLVPLARTRFSVTAGACFLFANSLVFLIMFKASVPRPKLLSQLSKVVGSLCLFSANAMALGWPSRSTLPLVSGVLPSELLDIVFDAHPIYSATYLASVLAAGLLYAQS